jgi:nuclear pore complex protein Nup88
LLSNESSTDVTSPLRRLHKEPFNTRIEKILHRTTSNPFLHGSLSSELTPQECFQLLSRVTQVFRAEYVMKQNHAREEIEQRIRILKEQKMQQFAELKDLQVTRQVVVRNTARLASKYNEAFDGQLQIASRVNALLKLLQEQLPALSDAEKGLQNDLRCLQDRTQEYEGRLQQLKDKKSYNDRVMGKDEPTSINPIVGLSGADLQRLKTVLTQEGQEISHLVQQINALQVHVSS